METSVQRAPGQRRLWSLLLLCFLGMACSGFCNYKFAPIISSLMEYWGVQEGLIGVLQSAQGWVCIFLLMPVAYLQKKAPPRWTGVLALGLLALGNVIGLIAPNFAFLIVGRILEGVGGMIIATLTQVLVLNSFGKRSATAMGVLTCATYVGQTINLQLSNLLVPTYGWQTVYAYMAVLEGLMAVVWLFYANRSVTILGLQDPNAPPPQVQQAEPSEKPKRGLGAVITNKGLWLITIANMLYGVCIIQFNSYVPHYLTTRGMTLEAANSLYNVSVICGVISMFSAGFISDKLKTKRKMAMFAFYAAVVIYYLLMKLPIDMMIVFMIFSGLIPRAASTVTFSAVGELLPPEDVPLGNSLLQMMIQVGNIVGNLFVGFLIQSAGYTSSIYVMMFIMLIAGLCWTLNRKVK